MTIEILEYRPLAVDAIVKPSKFPKIGHLKVQISPKLSVWLDVLKTDKSFFFRVPAVKAGDKWEPAYIFTEHAEFGKYIMESLGNEFKAKFL